MAHHSRASIAGTKRCYSPRRLRGDEQWQIALEVYSGRITEPHTFRRYELATRDHDADGLAHDLRAAYETLRILDQTSGDAALLTRALNAALALVDFRQPRSAAYYASLAAGA